MPLALHAHVRHRSPSTELRIVGLDRTHFRRLYLAVSTDRIDLATDRSQRQSTAHSAHVSQRLPAIGLWVVHPRRVAYRYLRCAGSRAAHSVELAIESDATMPDAGGCHACQLRPRRIRRVVQLHAVVDIAVDFAAHNVDQAGPEARAWHHLRAIDRRQHCVEEHIPCFRRAQRRPRTHGLTQEARRHRHEAHVLHHGKQLGLGPLAGLPPPHAPLEDGLFALSQLIFLHQRQHLRARRQLRRQLLEAAQRRLHRGLLEHRQREGVSEPPHVERVGRGEPRADRDSARLLERVDHEARGRLEHLGQQALVDLTFALVDKGQQRLERRRAGALERVDCIRCIAHP
eukprot:scaffold46379_cov72-Phaeocystis_antarctica.AAC.1